MDLPLHPLDYKGLFEALNEPVRAQPIGPRATRALKLSPNYLSKLQVTFDKQDGNELKRYQNFDRSLEARLANPNLINITELIHLNAKTNRPKEAQIAFDTIRKLGLIPDVAAYNHLLDAYATDRNYDVALKVFSEISKEGLKPDLVSYSTLIKVCVGNKDVDAAFKLYNEMKSREIWPNQIVFTMLIQGCLASKQLDRAWKTFHHMRTEIEQPDAICYGIMIGAAARTKDAEKALDLFQEMATYNIPATVATYNNLIRACGLRADYYLEAFSLFEQMVASGFEPNIHTYRTLVEISAANSDLGRARMVWNDYVTRLDPESLNDNDVVYDSTPMKPDVIIFSQMLKMYNQVLQSSNGLDIVQEKPVETSPLPDLIKIDLTPVKTSSVVLPLLKATETSRECVLFEATHVWNLALKMVDEGYIQMTSELWMRRLYFLSLDTSKDGVEASMKYFESASGLALNIRAYKAIFYQLAKGPHFAELGLQFWDKFLAWDERLETKMIERATSPLSAIEKDEVRAKSRRTRKEMQDCFMIAAHGMLASGGDLEGAIKFLSDSKVFRQPYYLPPLQLKSISKILHAAQRKADMGDLQPLKTIKELCPMVLDDPLAAVHAALRQKTIPIKWWGWSAMGVDEDQKQALIRKHEKAEIRVAQREVGYRKKSDKHQESKAAKPVVFRGFIPGN